MTAISKPIKLAGKTLSNRLVMAPLCIHKSVDGTVTDEIVNYYETRSAASHFGLIVIEHAYVRLDGKASPEQMSIADDAAIPGLARLAEAIHRHDTLTVLQINHAGNAAHRTVTGCSPAGPSAVFNPARLLGQSIDEQLPHELSSAEIDEIIECFVKAALRARKAGFDGVEVHAAHGFLLDQFYSPLTNKRTDEYSGSTIEGRTLLHRRILQAVRSVCGDDFIVSLRWGTCDYLPGGAHESDIPRAAQLLAEEGPDMISVSGGLNNFFKPGHTQEGWFSPESSMIKQYTDIPVLLTGGIRTAQAAEGFLTDGSADLIGIARPAQEDPAFGARFFE